MCQLFNWKQLASAIFNLTSCPPSFKMFFSKRSQSTLKVQMVRLKDSSNPSPKLCHECAVWAIGHWKRCSLEGKIAHIEHNIYVYVYMYMYIYISLVGQNMLNSHFSLVKHAGSLDAEFKSPILGFLHQVLATWDALRIFRAQLVRSSKIQWMWMMAMMIIMINIIMMIYQNDDIIVMIS